jgi:hypothetical protein
VIDDIAYAESLGISISYGYLFDPRYQTASDMERQICAIAKNPLLPRPIYLSVIAPLAGTESFWADLKANRLAPNLRLRDLDGETIAYAQLGDRPEAIVDFVERMFRRPWTVVGRAGILLKTLRRLLRARSLNPVRWYFSASANLHCFLWSRGTPSQPRSYLAGSDTLDPQYFERPDDLTDQDRVTYFDPIFLTDAAGGPSDWLKRYMPKRPVRTPRHAVRILIRTRRSLRRRRTAQRATASNFDISRSISPASLTGISRGLPGPNGGRFFCFPVEWGASCCGRARPILPARHSPKLSSTTRFG